MKLNTEKEREIDLKDKEGGTQYSHFVWNEFLDPEI